MLDFNKYLLTSNVDKEVTRTISANTEKSAWNKFNTQYFSALKPNRKDWTIKKIHSGIDS